MDKFREFQGPDLDDCIRQAMEWFNSPRETLEVEIIQAAKSGIFGIVGARKAKIRVRKAHVAESMRDFLESSGRDNEREASPTALKQGTETPDGDRTDRPSAKRSGSPAKLSVPPVHANDRKPEQEKSAAAAPKASAYAPKKSRQGGKGHGGQDMPGPSSPAGTESAGGEAQARSAEKAPFPSALEKVSADQELEDGENGAWPHVPAEKLDQEQLRALTLEVVRRLISPLADQEVGMHFDVFQGHPRVRVDWQGDAGLLIGREGQTLVAIQYLASRILSRQMQSSLRVRLDIGDYRARQNERLRELALSLAEKARRSGRSFSTRPLSSYHRRMIHVCLQDARDIQTRSAGEGPLKRVVISARRS